MSDVVPDTPVGWFSSFTVDGVLVKTVAIYTYQCEECGSQSCKHARAVVDYVIRQMDRDFARKK